MPLDGRCVFMRHIPGALFPVKKSAVNHVDELFVKNERLVCCFETSFGPMVMVLVAAQMVSTIETSFFGKIEPSNKIQDFDLSSNPAVLKQGEDMGCFYFGSTVVLLTARDFCDHVEPGSDIALKVNDVISKIKVKAS